MSARECVAYDHPLPRSPARRGREVTDKSRNSLISTSLYATQIRRMYEDKLEFESSPIYLKWREKERRQWLARPLYERAWIRCAGKVRYWRVRLGEIIAGREFE